MSGGAERAARITANISRWFVAGRVDLIEAEIKAVLEETGTQWIPVGERPSHCGQYLVLYTIFANRSVGEQQEVGSWDGDNWGDSDGDLFDCYGCKVTHYQPLQPLPAAPDEGGKR